MDKSFTCFLPVVVVAVVVGQPAAVPYVIAVEHDDAVRKLIDLFS